MGVPIVSNGGPSRFASNLAAWSADDGDSPDKVRGLKVQLYPTFREFEGERSSPEGGWGFPKRPCASRLLAETSLAGSNAEMPVAGSF